MTLVTEAEAKTKWCPFTRVAFGNGTVSGNRGFDGHPSHSESFCIASECMAWRWTTEPLNTTHREEIGRGYCGLAGAER